MANTNIETSYQELPPIIGDSRLGRFFGSRKFLRLLMGIALPVIVQELITTAVGMLDTVMIAPLGADAIAAVGQVNQFFFFFQVIVFGINGGGAIFYSQYHGRGDKQGIQQVLAICLKITTAIALVFMLLSIFFAKDILRILAPDPSLIEIGSQYLGLLAWSFVLFGLKQALGSVLRSMGQVKLPMRASVLAFVVNGSLNYILIFGKLGLPAMGVKGAAIATCIARVVELLWILRHILIKDKILEMKWMSFFKSDRQMRQQYLKISTPVIITETLWALSQLLYTMAYVRISTEAAAAIQLSGTVQNLLFVFIISLSSAAAVIVGQAIGAEEDTRAVIHPMTRRILRITIVFGIFAAAVELLAPDILMLAYSNLSPELWQMTANLLRVRGLFIMVRFLNSVLILGIFRAGGDVRVPMIVEMATTWCFAVPMAFVAGLVWNLGIFCTLAFVTFEEVLKLIFLYPRFKRQKWINLL